MLAPACAGQQMTAEGGCPTLSDRGFDHIRTGAFRGRWSFGQMPARWRLGLGCQVREDGGQELPAFRNRADVDALVGAVRARDVRAERNHVEPGNALAEDTALEAGVDGGNARWLAEEAFIDFPARCERGRLDVRLPAGIRIALCDAGRAGEFADGANLCEKRPIRPFR